MYLVYDTETTGLPKSYKAPISDSDNWPRMVQLAWQLHANDGTLIENHNLIIQPDGYDIPFNASKIHGITTKKAKEEGIPLGEALAIFDEALAKTQIQVGHNIEFDINIVSAEYFRTGSEKDLHQLDSLDTMPSSVNYCAIPGGRGGKFKYPKLEELHEILFKEKFDEAHNASADVNATARSFFELIRLKVFSQEETQLDDKFYQEFFIKNPAPFKPFDIQIDQQVKKLKEKAQGKKSPTKNKEPLTDAPYFHIHNHTSFSILSAASSIQKLVKKASRDNMLALGITDYGNLMGAFHFLNAIKSENKEREIHNEEIEAGEKEGEIKAPIKPIIGCELYIAEHYKQHKFTKDQPDKRFPQVLIAKNKKGYNNLSLLSSYGYIDGSYAGYPRISRELVIEHKENLMALTGGLNGEVPNLILNVGQKQAEEAFVWWKDTFGDDFYVELIRHDLEEDNHVNEILLRFAEKYKVKVIAQNNTFYIEQEDANAHDILLCIRDGEKKDTPVGRGRDKRFGFPNNEFYFKTQEEMKELFHDLPQAIENLQEIFDKITPFTLAQDVLLPAFDIPEEFQSEEDKLDKGKRGENAYLKHLTYEGAKMRYGEITDEIKERLEFELTTIENTGYPGYFLIVQDFTRQAKKMGVLVGPGRGSAAGSAVAYCIEITNVDPIKYDLLFERFLNPDRISLPDIDIDFDDRGRARIIEWVVNKYGKDRVAQIITYGTMAGKSAIRDTARVLNLPLADADRIAKKTHAKLNKFLHLSEKELKEKFNKEELADIQEIIAISQGDGLEAETINQAKIIEGSIRNTGTHACGIIITPIDIKQLVPVTMSKDADLYVTQFDNSVVEDAGLLKMDFLGLKTLTIINDAVLLVKELHDIDLVPDDFPLDDEKTYEIFKKGQTVGVFQYESAGMQKHLKGLQPDKFDDLIAMNALYRPGPLQYIPNFIERKHGREKIVYDLDACEEFLAETYGITVYQEQVMLLSQKLASFTKGEADTLRKAMGKKKKSELDKMLPLFLKNGEKNGHDKEKLIKIWTDWEAFASYAFNKSHSTCYAFIAYQTAYLKAHYPAEYMASVLSNNMNNIKDVSFFMEECKNMNIDVLGPDINESAYTFTVNKEGAIRFGMGAVKGVGGAAVESIIQERKEQGNYQGVFDFIKRVNLRTVNKKTIENLVYSGGFDEVDDVHRAQFFHEENGTTNLEKLTKFGNAFQEDALKSQTSLFGDAEEIEIAHPTLFNCVEWPPLYTLSKEKEVVGIYISSHPMDQFKEELESVNTIPLDFIQKSIDRLVNKEFYVAGMVTDFSHRISKNGKEFGTLSLEDYSTTHEFMLFGEDYLRFKHYLQANQFLLIRIKVTLNQYSKRTFTNITKIDLIQDVLEKYTKGLLLEIDINELNESMLLELSELVKNHPGKKDLYINFIDKKNELNLKMPSRKYKVNIQKELIQKIKLLPNLHYKIQ